MSRAVLVALVCSALVACGVDGEPVQPTVSGAVTISDGGIYPSVGVAVNKGPLSIFLGL